MSERAPGPKGGVTPLRIVVWVVAAAAAIAMIATGVVGILTKAR